MMFASGGARRERTNITKTIENSVFNGAQSAKNEGKLAFSLESEASTICVIQRSVQASADRAKSTEAVEIYCDGRFCAKNKKHDKKRRNSVFSRCFNLNMFEK